MANASDPKTAHIWMLDNRSLCDTRASTPSFTEDMTDDEFEEWMEEQENAPACGACLLLAGHIRRRACTLLEESGGKVWPEKPSAAWARLRHTRWARMFDFRAFLKQRKKIDAESRFDAVKYAVDPKSVAEFVAEQAEHRKHSREARVRARARAED